MPAAAQPHRDRLGSLVQAFGALAAVIATTTLAIPAPQTRIAVSDGYGCSLDAAATCWAGALISHPAGSLRFATIATGGATCGITTAGATWCWGGNAYGTLGSPDARGMNSTEVPVKVYGSE